jgi:hypothetical protein
MFKSCLRQIFTVRQMPCLWQSNKRPASEEDAGRLSDFMHGTVSEKTGLIHRAVAGVISINIPAGAPYDPTVKRDGEIYHFQREYSNGNGKVTLVYYHSKLHEMMQQGG